MIVKIDVTKIVVDEPESEDSSWIYYGEFMKVRVTRTTLEKANTYDWNSKWTLTETGSDTVIVIVATFMFSVINDERIIITDRPTYLMNDSGENIEKLLGE